MLFLTGLLLLLQLKFINCQNASFGSEFFIGITKNGYVIIPTPDALDLHITTPSIGITTFYVESINGILYNGTVASNISTTVNLNFSYIVTDSTYSNRNKGVRVYTENGGLISVLVVTNIILGSTNDHIAYPYQELNAQEYVYYTVSTETLSTSSLTLLVGTADHTTVTITPSQDIVIPEDVQNFTSPDVTLQAGSSRTITLNRLQTFMFEVKDIDLTGSKIVSNKPLTVVSGHECSYVPSDKQSCDAISVQVPPTATWGTKFLLTPHGGRTGGQYYKMVAAESNTTITHNCNNGIPVSNLLVTEGASLAFFTPSGTYCYAESDKPIFTAIFGTGGSLNGGVGDPVMSLVPSLDSYVYNDILFYIPSYSGFYSYWMNIMSTEPDPVVLMNKQTLYVNWTIINDTNGVPAGYAVQISLSSAVGVDHHISSNASITTLVYGWGNNRGFSYTAAGVKQITSELNVSG